MAETNISRACVVLTETSHPGNIGACARAMANMGLSDLRLVSPRRFPAQEATARAKHASHVLERAKVFASIEEAVGDCAFVIGSTARVRQHSPQAVDVLAAMETASQHLIAQQPIAIVMGREKDGLSNAELNLCRVVVTLETSPEYGSLNIASALQVFVWCLRRQLLQAVESHEPTASEADYTPTHADLQKLLADVIAIARTTDFLSEQTPKRTAEHLQRWLVRSNPNKLEYGMLRGLFAGVRRRLDQGETP